MIVVDFVMIAAAGAHDYAFELKKVAGLNNFSPLQPLTIPCPKLTLLCAWSSPLARPGRALRPPATGISTFRLPSVCYRVAGR